MTEEKKVNKFQAVGKTKVIKGSILAPENSGLRFVLSVNNLAGKPEGNTLLPIFDKKWKKVREESRGWFANKTGAYKLGAINTTAVQSDTWVIHCLVQDEQLKTSAKAVEECLKKVCASAKAEKASVHISSLLVKEIPQLAELAKTQLLDNGISVYFYEEQVK